LSRAAERGDIAVVELLLKNGAQPDFEDEKGCTPLSRAIEGEATEQDEVEVREEGEGERAVVVQLLLAQGAKVNYRYELKEGTTTPLSRAVERGNEVVVWLLLTHGAQPDLEDAAGHTPLSRAEHAGSEAVLHAES